MQFTISMFGLFVCLLLLINIKQTNRVNIYLIFFLVLINLFNVIQYCTMFSNNKYLAAICLVHFQPIIVLTGPVLYFYVRGVLKDDAQLSKKDWIHFVPFLLYLINVSRYYFYSLDYKLAYAESVIQHREIMLNFDPVLFSGNISYIFRSLLVLTYTTSAAIMVYKHFKNDIRSHFQNALIFRWLTAFISFNYIMNISIFYYVGQLLYNWNLNGSITVIPWGAFLFGLIALITLNLIIFFFPDILYGLPRMDYRISKQKQIVFHEDLNASASKTVKDFEISIEKLELIAEKLKDYAITNPFINPDFNLTTVSNNTKIPKHHISYFFKVYLNTDFIEWKNNARVDYVIQLVNSGEAENLTLDAVSKMAGFVSRSTFINAFKQKTGMTPSEFFQ
jgi:AraC-like DNA-binding protein